MQALRKELKNITLRLCGIAVSNRRIPPGLSTAFLGVVVRGECFEQREEQNALLGILDELEGAHGWPVAGPRDKLKQSWDWL
ncbi:uncharacterized protein Z518_03617 [Rhinocladiella mackenziei CBS 650.93]|uniref:Uncharacterized protein n=1 Tax=Rhinocladiella mackenziei CBS 650.93 TaxID=1442369 RepID=A0A0D2J951_9EURO|nr:uncharacterized protein Z518_03617 [Rhinocladiella mackenziei CBS 650.93]KIX05645.1 hypothetical protein Z518_03617 [Rhinocladiella mackenziei CBS 650.93]